MKELLESAKEIGDIDSLNELEKLDHTYTRLLKEEKKVTIRKLEQESKKK